MSSALCFENVSKTYRNLLGRVQKNALEGFSVQVPRGEIFGFLGPNGAGKTTAIHIALGFLRPTSGRGAVLGKPFGDEHVRLRVGFLPESIVLPRHRSRDVVRLAALLNGVPNDTAAKRTDDLLDRLDLTNFAQTKVNKLSRGTVQRLGLATALVNDPELLILDEPTSALDPSGRALVRDLLLDRKRQGKTVFVSSHLLSEIEIICDRVAFLIAGQVVRTGQTQEILEDSSQFEITATAPQADTTQTIRVAAVEQQAAIERIWAAGGTIRRVTPVRRTLEDVFLELTANGSSPSSMDRKTS